ncbi:MAG: hypothetical protein AAFX79_12700 [Planctomycetota bacterium]
MVDVRDGRSFRSVGEGGVGGLAWAVGVCSVVLTAWVLGAGWLAAGVLGLPAGLWIILGVLGGRWLINGPLLDQGVESVRRSSEDQPPRIGVVLAGATERVASVAERVLDAAAPDGENTGGTPGEAFRRPLRIGVAADADTQHALERTSGALPADFVPVRGPQTLDGPFWRSTGLDGIIEQAERGGPLRLHIAVRDGKPAAWRDWASPLPRSYAGLFPIRFDPERVTLADVQWSADESVELVRATAEVAALLGRHPARLGRTDRWRGRPPLALLLGTRMVSDPALDAAMANLLAVLEAAGPEAAGAPMMRALASYLALPACGLEPGARGAAARLIGRLDAPEGETLLRASAAAFASGRDVLGYDLLLTGHQHIARGGSHDDGETLEFALSDIAFNREGGEVFGRVAAGIAFATALVEPERVPYVLDDLRDEIASAPWLQSNPDEQEGLLRVIEALSQPGLRAAA